VAVDLRLRPTGTGWISLRSVNEVDVNYKVDGKVQIPVAKNFTFIRSSEIKGRATTDVP